MRLVPITSLLLKSVCLKKRPANSSPPLPSSAAASRARIPPNDRPCLETVMSTGTIYIPGNGTGGNPVHRQTFLRASRDNGKTWGLVYACDTPDCPQGGGASKPRAAHGVRGIAYVASAVPAGSGDGEHGRRFVACGAETDGPAFRLRRLRWNLCRACGQLGLHRLERPAASAVYICSPPSRVGDVVIEIRRPRAHGIGRGQPSHMQPHRRVGVAA